MGSFESLMGWRNELTQRRKDAKNSLWERVGQIRIFSVRSIFVILGSAVRTHPIATHDCSQRAALDFVGASPSVILPLGSRSPGCRNTAARFRWATVHRILSCCSLTAYLASVHAGASLHGNDSSEASSTVSWIGSCSRRNSASCTSEEQYLNYSARCREPFPPDLSWRLYLLLLRRQQIGFFFFRSVAVASPGREIRVDHHITHIHYASPPYRFVPAVSVRAFRGPF